jgi:histidyl-tRNA synthetase
MKKPSLPKGTRDFLPSQVAKRNYIFKIIENTFKNYGFLPIETPAMESLATLTGKYGEEGDRLLFKVLNNGDFLSNADENALSEKDSVKIIPSISKRGLRYDLTVPFARFVVMNQNELQFPFKRYQIQPVWRADRPQKGRYQEFYQCDVDVVGSDSLMYEAELLAIYHDVFKAFNLNVTIKLNNRKILFGIAECHGIADKFMDMTIALDKLDKIGADKVVEEMTDRAIGKEVAYKIIELIKNPDLDNLEKAFENTETGTLGIQEIKSVFNYIKNLGLDDVVFDPQLARGLGYYTGCIFEVEADKNSYPDLVMGSIGGGGRYDDLTGVFGMPNVSGVGVSFGAERIYDVLEELNLFPADVEAMPKAIFLAFDDACHLWAFDKVMQLRRKGIAVDIYPEPAKFKKQMKYADARGFEYVIIIGDQEMAANSFTFKDLKSGTQELLNFEQVTAKLA